jgi:DNA gyrase subunit A
VIPLESSEEIVSGLALPAEMITKGEDTDYVVFITEAGMVKKSSLANLPGPSAKSFTAIKVGEDDNLGWVYLTHGEDDLLLVNNAGYAIRFSESKVRPMGLAAAGVMGMRLAGESKLVGAGVVRSGSELFLIAKDGASKRITLNQFPTQGRHGKGVLVWKSDQNVILVGATIGRASLRATAILAKAAHRSIRGNDTPRAARTALGKQIFPIKDGDHVLGLTPVIQRPDFTHRTPKSSKTRTRSTSRTRQKKTTS